MQTRSRVPLPVAALAVLALLAGCAPEPPAPSPSSSRTASATPTPTPTRTVDPIAGMSLEDRVGQLFMVGTSVDGVTPETLAAVQSQRIGGVFLHGRSSAGVDATSSLVSQFTGANPTTSPALWVATDQEGGDVQVLSGPGFDDIPSAVTQATDGCDTLRASALGWAGSLSKAGVNMNLAPVADIVTSPDTAGENPPIGALDREYGYDEATVAACAGAFAQGMRAAGVLPTFKHFPGLGRVAGNTDVSADVVDTAIGPDSPDVDVYRTLLAEGPAVVMVSTAVYQQIDPAAPAAFSPPVVTGLLRGRLGYDGVVTTDDLSAAAQVQQWAPGDRAVLAIRAGVDLLLVSADPSVFPEMYDAVLKQAENDPSFAALVDASARRIVELKSSFR
ncbi:glycoside hydrolase family 3 N-terminal domain-containing protein [Microbacterium sp. SORGH_AS_0888]|uniref:glycoside hydrolase family 3 N-terminal domain-containing protein n=1 Tax=Microbacterium sp. SORGH_AS_0888 TaxID=3041791 RepID=UPI0027852F2A|nr:glycoside hydrolase family 3 N-terminal domain-containing protein [Microbacterium sp. SORGH_AS_0888]MDQ1130160.1 beta-N-acetylhexosaminidase [Microbacterium sp. SORGH_AS_0888]